MKANDAYLKVEGKRAFRAEGVQKYFGKGETRIHVLKETKLEAPLGELLMLVGPSGCGKTTLLSVLAGTLSIEGGEVDLLGHSLKDLRGDKLARFRAQHIGFIFQSFNLIPTISVLDNVTVPVLLQGGNRRVAAQKAKAMLEAVGLGGREKSLPGKLSGGQQQRVAIARALVHDPTLLICDEPTSALDKDTGAKVMQLIRDVARSPNRCVLVVTHDNRIFKYADRIAEMEDGRISQIHTNPAEMSAHYV